MSNLKFMRDILKEYGVNRDFYFARFLGDEEDETPNVIRPTKCYITHKKTDFLDFFTIWNSTTKNCILNIKINVSDNGGLFYASDSKEELEKTFKFQLETWADDRREYLINKSRADINKRIDNFIDLAKGKKQRKRL